MSRIHLETPTFRVLTGWDRPLQTFFLDISALRQRGGARLHYSSAVNRPSFEPMPAEEVLAQLAAHGVPTPPDLADVLADHRTRNLGNVILTWASLDGHTWSPPSETTVD